MEIIVQILKKKMEIYIITLPVPIPDEEKKLSLSFYFRTSLWCLKRFYEGLIETCQMILLSFYLKSDFMYSVS